jgi:hypothetical protein
MPEKNNNFLPGYDSIVSSLYNSYRGESGTLDSDLLESGLIKKVNTSFTSNDNVSHFVHGKETVNTYKTKFASSADSIFCPYTTNFDETGTPHFEAPYSDNNSPPTGTNNINSLKLNPFNPNNELTYYYASTGSTLWNVSTDSGNGTEYSGFPVISGTGVESGWLTYGHNISWAMCGTGQWNSYGFDSSFMENTGTVVEVENIRAVGLRAPLVLTGWGYDTEGNPVPADTGNSELFASGAFSDPSQWKSGPVDLRWDDQRKVWTGGPGREGTVRFIIIDVNATIGRGGIGCDVVSAQVTSVGCGTEGVEVGDIIDVYDFDFCHFNLPLQLLIGMTGTAHKMANPYYNEDYAEDLSDCTQDVYNQGSCLWEVAKLCCAEQYTFIGDIV